MDQQKEVVAIKVRTKKSSKKLFHMIPPKKSRKKRTTDMSTLSF
jgi:hypothetical protein